MRQLQKPWLSALVRVVCTALFVLGIALVDLSAVWAQGPAAPSATLASVDPLPSTLGCTSVSHEAAAREARRACPALRLVLGHCFTSDCRDGASLMGTSRPHSALSRTPAGAEAEPVQPGDLLLHRIPPLALLPESPSGDDDLASATAGPKPARAAGADRSIPRPPPA